MSPRAQFATDAGVGLAVALIASAALLTAGVFWEWTPLLVVLCGVFALLWGFTAPTARLLLGYFWDDWGRHVEGLRERGPERQE